MIAIPAVDLRDGACVQLVGGDYAREQVRLEDPPSVAREWARYGFARLHVVDLDAAMGKGSNAGVVEDILREGSAAVQVGGGLRSTDRVTDVLDAGARFAIVGTRALEDMDWLAEVAEANPGVIIFSPARRGRNNTTKHSFHNVKAVPEVVINVVTWSMVQQISVASGEFPEGINEFEKSGLTPIASEKVRPFRVKESPVQFECKVQQVIETGTGGGAANLVVCEVVLVHVDEAMLGADGKIDQRRIDLVGRMGGATYCRAHGDALFELTQPNQHYGVGVDALVGGGGGVAQRGREEVAVAAAGPALA